MRQATGELVVATRRQGLHEITRDVADWLDAQGIATGVLTLFCRHTSASLTVNENAAPAVRRDLERWIARVAPESRDYEHDDEGPDDMPAHLRTAMTDVSLSIPIVAGAMALGTWQGVYLFEHRTAPHRRRVVMHVMGE
ncbi:hypothetical protein ASG29_01090 [Sphingomonas sp. Leaf412]|uniref:secondary thiamine-phosphate synthase enzyme YjbQ n=1 Tax=Sphingomonas sp. Leaf412 TaxID=1736370 RepID=UPI0006FF6B41|nr:secondary thiamine-phosphate synthase enzyme YjbQ [Sphingomonas sp. Leaf412]KQT34787.1 hypothetical protein ASG29_01090 [Sphingomonas sp. Leaf412]